MKNLFNSPFEYWEKIGYVGYNNYTDLHLKVKKSLFYKEWVNTALKAGRYTNNLVVQDYLYNTKDQINDGMSVMRINNKKNIKIKKFKSYLVFNLFFNLYKKIYIIHTNFVKIINFIKNWKKNKYLLFFKLTKKKYFKNRYLKYVVTLIQKIYAIYFKLIYFIFKKNLLLIKTKIYRYLKYFNQYQYMRKKKKNIIQLNKKLMKNTYLIYKNPKVLYQLYVILFGEKDIPLSKHHFLRDKVYDVNRSTRSGLFQDIPKVNIKEKKKRFKFFLTSCFNCSLYDLKLLHERYQLKSWEDFFFFFSNNMKSLLSSFELNKNNISDIILNGKNINDKISLNSLFMQEGDFLEVKIKEDVIQLLNKKLFLFFFFVKCIKKQSFLWKYYYTILCKFSFYLHNQTHLVER